MFLKFSEVSLFITKEFTDNLTLRKTNNIEYIFDEKDNNSLLKTYMIEYLFRYQEISNKKKISKKDFPNFSIYFEKKESIIEIIISKNLYKKAFYELISFNFYENNYSNEQLKMINSIPVLKFLFLFTKTVKYFCLLYYSHLEDIINHFCELYVKDNNENPTPPINDKKFHFDENFSLEELKAKFGTNIKNKIELLNENVGKLKIKEIHYIIVLDVYYKCHKNFIRIANEINEIFMMFNFSINGLEKCISSKLNIKYSFINFSLHRLFLHFWFNIVFKQISTYNPINEFKFSKDKDKDKDKEIYQSNYTSISQYISITSFRTEKRKKSEDDSEHLKNKNIFNLVLDEFQDFSTKHNSNNKGQFDTNYAKRMSIIPEGDTSNDISHKDSDLFKMDSNLSLTEKFSFNDFDKNNYGSNDNTYFCNLEIRKNTGKDKKDYIEDNFYNLKKVPSSSFSFLNHNEIMSKRETKNLNVVGENNQYQSIQDSLSSLTLELYCKEFLNKDEKQSYLLNAFEFLLKRILRNDLHNYLLESFQNKNSCNYIYTGKQLTDIKEDDFHKYLIDINFFSDKFCYTENLNLVNFLHKYMGYFEYSNEDEVSLALEIINCFTDSSCTEVNVFKMNLTSSKNSNYELLEDVIIKNFIELFIFFFKFNLQVFEKFLDSKEKFYFQLSNRTKKLLEEEVLKVLLLSKKNTINEIIRDSTIRLYKDTDNFCEKCLLEINNVNYNSFEFEAILKTIVSSTDCLFDEKSTVIMDRIKENFSYNTIWIVQILYSYIENQIAKKLDSNIFNSINVNTVNTVNTHVFNSINNSNLKDINENQEISNEINCKIFKQIEKSNTNPGSAYDSSEKKVRSKSKYKLSMTPISPYKDETLFSDRKLTEERHKTKITPCLNSNLIFSKILNNKHDINTSLYETKVSFKLNPNEKNDANEFSNQYKSSEMINDPLKLNKYSKSIILNEKERKYQQLANYFLVTFLLETFPENVDTTLINKNSDFLHSINNFFLFQSENFQKSDDFINKELKKRNIILHLNSMNPEEIEFIESYTASNNVWNDFIEKIDISK